MGGLEVALFVVGLMAWEHYGLTLPMLLVGIGVVHVIEEWVWPGGFARWQWNLLLLRRPLPTWRQGAALLVLILALGSLGLWWPAALAALAGLFTADLATHLPWGRQANMLPSYPPGTITAWFLFPVAASVSWPEISAHPLAAAGGAAVIAGSWLVVWWRAR